MQDRDKRTLGVTKKKYKIAYVYKVLTMCFVMCATVVQASDFLESDICQVQCFCEYRKEESGYKVDCTAKNLTTIPGGIDRDTVILDLSMNNLTTLPEDGLSHLRRLKMLHLVSNSLTSLPPNMFSGLFHLSKLFLQGNKFEEVPSRALRDLHSLQLLYLDANRISKVPANSFKNLPNLKQLRLDFNRLTQVPVKALNMAPALEAIDLSVNQIETVPDYAFRNLTNTLVLLLSDNRISHVGDHAFEGLPVIQTLDLNKNRLEHIPIAISALPDLFSLSVAENEIEYIPNGIFAGNKKLSILHLQNNPISSVGNMAFKDLPFLNDLKVSEARDLTEFPDLTGTTGLEELTLDRASIKILPADVCHHMSSLEIFDVHSNKVSALPNMTGCGQLMLINIGNNEITSLESSPFKGLVELKDLILGYNRISHIPADAFQGLQNLQYLDLSYNRISSIHPDAFQGLSKLEDLNLGENRFPVLPTKGLSNLRHLKTFHNRELLEPPLYSDFPNMQTLALAYAYHCCDFIRRSKVIGNPVEGFRFNEEFRWLEDPNITSHWDETSGNKSYIHDLPLEPEIDAEIKEMYENPDYYLPSIDDVDDVVLAKPPVDCRPTPGPFLPCDDLFGWWSLRCGVWIVFLLAVLGNGAVLFVSITSKSKMDVTRFLICNLACADLFMGIYLGFLAIVDASTLGEFEKYAVRWQISPGCLVAGFLGVLSSELSVFTLTIITVERFYAISNAMQLDKRLSLRNAGYIMLAGWIFCVGVASLPLFEVSDYRKFAICLPFETENSVSLGYVCFIMIFNALSFLVIVCCYVIMYVTIRGSHAWNSNDSIVAKRMALLVFTDFFCWAPIIFFSITAAFESNFAQISLDEAKVLTIFVLPLNSCANPFLYAFFTRQFKKDCVKLCKRIEESSLSRHFPSSGIRRPSNSSNRQMQSNTYNVEKRRSISNSDMAGSSGGDMSNNNCESDITGKKVHFHGKEESLQYVRSDSGIHIGDSKSIQLSDLSPESDQRGNLNIAIGSKTTMETELNDSSRENSPEIKESDEDLLGSSPDIVLHTEEGHIYLNTAPVSDRKVCPPRKRLEQQGRAKRLDKRQKPERATTAKRHVATGIERGGVDKHLAEKQTSIAQELKNQDCRTKTKSNRCNFSGNPSDLRSKGKSTIMPHKMQQREVPVHFDVEPGELTSEEISREERNQRRPSKKCIPRKREGHLSAATQTDVDPQSMSHPFLPGGVDKKDRRKQINEWRKTSHLSFLWKNADNFDTLIPTQKSNSLVELTRQVRDHKDSPGKRHSLSSHHEGYILLKNGNGESTYDDEDLYEIHEGRVVYVPHAKLKNVGNNSKESTKGSLIWSASAGSRKKRTCSNIEDSPEAAEPDETSGLLDDQSCSNFCDQKSKQKPQSCDDESGISSSSQ